MLQLLFFICAICVICGQTLLFPSCYHPKMDNPEHDITTSDPAAIEALIASEASPVGIDAKKTHIIIISKLVQIEQRLDKLEQLARQSQP